MKDPCDACVVKSCCSNPCYEHSEYLYDSELYLEYDVNVHNRIRDMSRDNAIQKISDIEKFYFYLKTVYK